MEIIGGELGFVGARRRGRCFGQTLLIHTQLSIRTHPTTFSHILATMPPDVANLAIRRQ
ncbi:hypothetical protein DER44DRAFT_794382 [Fusarium oxysporum]|nr:hypothetical protein DER44DRAFT_794382 [Fusarium oxysporum]